MTSEAWVKITARRHQKVQNKPVSRPARERFSESSTGKPTDK
jgi:hypothetical protein